MVKAFLTKLSNINILIHSKLSWCAPTSDYNTKLTVSTRHTFINFLGAPQHSDYNTKLTVSTRPVKFKLTKTVTTCIPSNTAYLLTSLPAL